MTFFDWVKSQPFHHLPNLLFPHPIIRDWPLLRFFVALLRRSRKSRDWASSFSSSLTSLSSSSSSPSPALSHRFSELTIANLVIPFFMAPAEIDTIVVESGPAEIIIIVFDHRHHPLSSSPLLFTLSIFRRLSSSPRTRSQRRKVASFPAASKMAAPSINNDSYILSSIFLSDHHPSPYILLDS